MVNKMQGSHLLVILMIFFFVHFVCHSTNGKVEVENPKQMLSLVNIGVVQDVNSPFDAMINLCIEMAISDFYLGHPNYTTRLGLHAKHAQSRLDVDLAGHIVANKWSLFVLVCWLFMAFVLMQSFTANLSAILTVDQLKFTFSKDHYIGFHKASFMKKFLIETLNINESRLRGYSSVEGFHDAMSKGSQKGGVDAIFDEIPYMKLLVNQYYPQYKITPPTYRTDGLGFAFPIGSPLTSYFSRAILNVTQGPDMISIERKYFGVGYSSQDPLSNTLSQGTSSLTFHEFAGLFIIIGSLSAFAIICSETALLSILKTITGRFVDKFLLKTNRGKINVDEDASKSEDDADGAPLGLGPLGEDRGEQRNGELELLQDRGEEIAETTLNNEANDVQDAEGETHDHPASTL